MVNAGWRRSASILAIAVVAVLGTLLTGGYRGFGVVDEPLYAVNAIELAGSVVDQHPADLDLTSSSHPPFGAQLLALGLLATPIFPEPELATGEGGNALCTISVPLGDSPPVVLSAEAGPDGWRVRAGEAEIALPSEPRVCVDLVNRAALLLADGTVAVLQLAQVGGETRLLASNPVVDPAGGWTAIAPAGSEADGSLLARSATGYWSRIGDFSADEQIAPTRFNGERLLGVGAVGYLDGTTANLSESEAQSIIRLFDVCAENSCDAAREQIRTGRMLLNGDVEPASADDFLMRLREIGDVTYGHTRLALGVQGDAVALLDLGATEPVLATIPLSATRLRWTVGSRGREGWQALLATKTRLSSMALSVFPSPSLTITGETRFNEIVGLYPAGGGTLAAVGVIDADARSRLVLVERTRLRSVTGRYLTEGITPVSEFAVSMSGGRGSTVIGQTAAGETLRVDTGAAVDRLRLMPAAAIVALAAAAAAIGAAISISAGLAAGALVLLSTIAWEQTRVGMLDGWLAAFVAWQIVAVLYALRNSGKRRLLGLALAGLALGAATGMKLSGLIIGLPLLVIGAAATSVSGARSVTRLMLQLVGALGVVVSSVGVVAGAGFGGVLNIVASAAMILVARRGVSTALPVQVSRKERLTAVVVAFGTAGVATLAALILPALLGATVGGVALDSLNSVLLWLQEAVRIAEGFTLDHPLALPFWGLVAGLGLGFTASAAPGLFAAIWTGVTTKLPVKPNASSELVSLLFLIALLTIGVWAPLSRILFPWYAAPIVVPAAAAIGIAIAQRDQVWRLLPLAFAVAPAGAWLAGPTVCLAALSRLDRGCQAISDVSITGTVVLIVTSVLAATLLNWNQERISRLVGGRVRGFLVMSLLMLLATLATLNASANGTVPALSGFQVVVAMEVLWGSCLLFLIWAWRTNRHTIAFLVGAQFYLVELLRIFSGRLQLDPWYLAPTQVGRVIPKPLLHPVPMSVMGVVMLLLLIVAAYVQWRSRKGAV
jgi:hypothetical protein